VGKFLEEIFEDKKNLIYVVPITIFIGAFIFSRYNVARTMIDLIWVVVVAAFFIPLESVKKNNIFVEISRVPIEILLSIFLIALIALDSFSWRANASGSFINLQFLIIWFLVMYFFQFLVFYIKDMRQEGFWKALCGRSCGRSIIVKMLKLDLKSANGRKIFWIVFLNGALVATWFTFTSILSFDLGDGSFILIGLFFFIIYLYMLTVIIRRKSMKARADYLELLEIVQSISEGNFDVNMNADLGLFNSMKYELSSIKNGFETAVNQAVASERMKTDLISNVSHDLKTPLTSIITYVDLLKSAELDDEKRGEYIGILEQKSNRLKDLIENLFEVSKASSGDIKMNLQKIDVTSLVRQTLLEVEDKTTAAELDVRPGYPEHSISLMLDGNLMHRVLENLVLNMTKYAMPGTRAYIDVTNYAERVAIVFRNISKHEINIDGEMLSERFVRGDKSRNTEGSGLGLAIAKSFTELQGGTLEIIVDGDLFKVVIVFEKAKSGA